MALTNAVPVWNLEMPAGALQQWTLTLTSPLTGAPYDISGATWEYVARSSPADAGTPLISITPAGDTAGLITVTSTSALSQLLLDIYPAATAPLAGITAYHSLWMNPGTDGALSLFTGQLITVAAPQP